jgi:Tat protein translocase TatB subunit
MGNNLFGIGFGELAFIVILALIVFGPKRIPEVARTIGRFLQQVRQATAGVEDEVRQLIAGEGNPATWLEGTLPKGPVALPPSGAEPFSPPRSAQGIEPPPAVRTAEAPESTGDDVPPQGDDGSATTPPAPLAG